MKTWIVYCHINKINGKKYIGITYRRPTYRWRNGSGYIGQSIFWKAIKKYGWENFSHIILETKLTEEQAKLQEQYWIAYYHTFIGDQKCNGYNATSGGDIPWNAGKQMSFEQKSSWHSKIKNNNRWSHKGHKRDKETVDKIKKSHIKYSKPVFCVETNKIFSSIKDAKRQTGIDHISECVNGKRKTAGSYHWKYLEK